MDANDSFDPYATHPKPAFDDFAELPPPIMGHGTEHDRRSTDRPASFLMNMAYLTLGIILSAVALGSPGCVGGPAVSAKGEVSVKEVGLIARVGGGAGGAKDGTGELAANVSISLVWPSK